MVGYRGECAIWKMDFDPSTSFSDFNFFWKKLCSTWKVKVSLMSFVCVGNMFNYQNSPNCVRVTCRSNLMTRCISEVYSHYSSIILLLQTWPEFLFGLCFFRSSLKCSMSSIHMPGKSMNELQGQNCEFWTKLTDANYSKSELKKKLDKSSWSWD